MSGMGVARGNSREWPMRTKQKRRDWRAVGGIAGMAVAVQ